MSEHLDLHLLGPPEIMVEGVPVSFRYDKMRGLLIYLAVEARRPPPRDVLAGLLWPDTPDRDARRNLNQALFNLRQALHENTDATKPQFLLANRDTLQFNTASDHALDVANFQAL